MIISANLLILQLNVSIMILLCRLQLNKLIEKLWEDESEDDENFFDVEKIEKNITTFKEF